MLIQCMNYPTLVSEPNYSLLIENRPILCEVSARTDLLFADSVWTEVLATNSASNPINSLLIDPKSLKKKKEVKKKKKEYSSFQLILHSAFHVKQCSIQVVKQIRGVCVRVQRPISELLHPHSSFNNNLATVCPHSLKYGFPMDDRDHCTDEDIIQGVQCYAPHLS